MSKTILTIDDSASIRQMVAMTLKSAGLTVLEAGNGLEGYNKATTETVHAPVTFLITASNWSCLKGLTIQPVAPASRAWRFSSSSDSVVNRITGMPLPAGC